MQSPTRRQPKQNMIWVPKNTPTPQYLELPRDVYSTIGTHVLPKYQPDFRRLNQTARSSDISVTCYKDISPNEIANWLLEQQKLIRDDIQKRKSKFWDLDRNKYDLTLELNKRLGSIIFNIDYNTGDIKSEGVKLVTQDSIIGFLILTVITPDQLLIFLIHITTGIL